MFYLIEKDNSNMKIENFLWLDLIQSSKEQHEYIECTIEDLPKHIPNTPQLIIPLGSINFTNAVFNLKYNIPQMNPIEVPKCLRNNEYLGRLYTICDSSEIPTQGSKFIKDATQMKGMTYMGDLQRMWRENLKDGHKYVVSEIVAIQAEYRVYIINGAVYAIEYYNGDPCILPDAKKIQMMNLRYMMQPDYPFSYTMDIMVTEQGTFLTEIHPTLFSCGLYTTVLSDSFLKGYEDGLRYILQHNTPVQI